MKILTITCFFLFLFSCMNSESTNQIHKSQADNKSDLNNDINLYRDFILNLEKQLWSMESFVKTDYKEVGWQLIDKSGKYIIKSNLNFTENRDTSLRDYALTIVEIDNEMTNKGKNRDVDIDYYLSDGRKKTITIPFIYEVTKSEFYGEKTLYFPFNYGIIVDFKTCFNDDYYIEWNKDGTIKRFDMDCDKLKGLKLFCGARAISLLQS